jgi:hypothetical protein
VTSDKPELRIFVHKIQNSTEHILDFYDKGIDYYPDKVEGKFKTCNSSLFGWTKSFDLITFLFNHSMVTKTLEIVLAKDHNIYHSITVRELHRLMFYR